MNSRHVPRSQQVQEFIEDDGCLTAEDLDQEVDFLIRELISRKYDIPFEAVPLEFFDVFEVVANGAKKYAMNGWLEPNGKSASEKKMHDSMFHHLAESWAKRPYRLESCDDASHCWFYPQDKESGLDPLLHNACRSLMVYTRRQRNIHHEEDK